jgi:ribonucleotide reductase beta subunit family protein with ferritin-like domain
MFTQTIRLAKDLESYNRGRRDEQKAIENVLEVLTLQGLLDPATLNLLIEEIIKIDRRPRREEK